MKDFDFANANVVILVYAIDKVSTFKMIDDLHTEALQFAQPNCLYYLVGNKVDMADKGQRQVVE